MRPLFLLRRSIASALLRGGNLVLGSARGGCADAKSGSCGSFLEVSTSVRFGRAEEVVDPLWREYGGRGLGIIVARVKVCCIDDVTELRIALYA